jgi:hypothetical protein
MKKRIIALILTLLTYSAFANKGAVAKISATGQKNITLATIINPFGGARSGARLIAKQNLIHKCKEKFNGTIVGTIQYKTIRFDEGVMAAIVKASGECQY